MSALTKMPPCFGLVSLVRVGPLLPVAKRTKSYLS